MVSSLPFSAPPSSARSRAETRERLRALIRRLESCAGGGRVPAPGTRRDRAALPSVEAVFPGASSRETAAGPCVVIEQQHSFDSTIGRRTLAELHDVSPGLYALLAPTEGLEAVALTDLRFVDIETTGLGGAGAVAFLVALGRVERREGRDVFVLRQYLATSPPEEAGVMAALIEDSGLRDGDPVLVTYNGRSFDAPMLDERATMHRMRAGFDALPHLDLLLPVRTALRGVLESCRLATVESRLLGVTRPQTEVPGAEVPAYYFRYLRSGDPRLLAPIVDHNAIDVLSLAGLLGWAAGTLGALEQADPLSALALGRLHQARNDRRAAIGWFERAIGAFTTAMREPAREDALLRLALLYKAEGARHRAVPLWRELAGGGTGTIAPLIEIAKHEEHDRRDFAGALCTVDEALRAVDRLAGLAPGQAERWREELEWRRARLERRQASAQARAGTRPGVGRH